MVSALILAPRQRRRIVGLLVTGCAAVAAVAAVHPGALHRITDIAGGSSGRSDLWHVAWQVFTGHVIHGVGFGNFQAVEGQSQYLLGPGFIDRIQYLTDVPYVVHNTYLQLLAEGGIVALVAFLVVLLGSLRACWLAAARFEASGQTAYADLAKATMIGTIGMLSAIFFLSDGADMRLWVMLALGPALLSVARPSALVKQPVSVSRSPG